MIQLECGQCGMRFAVGGELAGSDLACRNCGQRIPVAPAIPVAKLVGPSSKTAPAAPSKATAATPGNSSNSGVRPASSQPPSQPPSGVRSAPPPGSGVIQPATGGAPSASSSGRLPKVVNTASPSTSESGRLSAVTRAGGASASGAVPAAPVAKVISGTNPGTNPGGKPSGSSPAVPNSQVDQDEPLEAILLPAQAASPALKPLAPEEEEIPSADLVEPGIPKIPTAQLLEHGSYRLRPTAPLKPYPKAGIPPKPIEVEKRDVEYVVSEIKLADNKEVLRWVAWVCAGGIALLLLMGTWRLMDNFQSPSKAPIGKEADETLAAMRARHLTKLMKAGPAPQPFDNAQPAGAERVTFDGKAGRLFGWYAKPPGPGPHPAVVCAHGGWALGDSDFDDVRPLLDAGFAVLVPAWRAENGNPGNFEMYFGEVDDALSALDFLAKQPEIDGNRLFICGHSAGGTLAMLVAEVSPRVRGAMACGGFPDMQAVIEAEKAPPFDNTPFDWRIPDEGTVRSPARFVKDLQCPLLLCYGASGDELYTVQARTMQERGQKIGKTILVETLPDTDHFNAYPPAVRRAAQWFQTLPGFTPTAPNAGKFPLWPDGGYIPPSTMPTSPATPPQADRGSPTATSPAPLAAGSPIPRGLLPTDAQAPQGWRMRVDRPTTSFRGADVHPGVRIPFDLDKHTEIVYPSTPSPYLVLVHSDHAKIHVESFDLATNQKQFTFETKTGATLKRCALSADGKNFLAHVHARAPILALCDMERDRIISRMALQASDEVRFFDFLNKDHYLLIYRPNTSTQEPVVAMCHRDSGTVETSITSNDMESHSQFALTPGKNYIAGVTRDSVVLFELTEEAKVGQLPLSRDDRIPGSPCEALAFSPDGSELLAIFQHFQYRHLIVWDVASGTRKLEFALDSSVREPNRFVIGAQPRVTWLPNQFGWLLYDKFIVERAQGRMVWRFDADDPPRLEAPVTVLDPGIWLTVRSNAKQGLLQLSQFPQTRIEQTLQAMAGGNLGRLKPGAGISLSVDVGAVRFGTADTTRNRLHEALRSGLARHALRDGDGHTQTLKLRYSEAVGNTETYRENPANRPIGATPVPPTEVVTTNITAELSLLVHDQPVWMQPMTVSFAALHLTRPDEQGARDAAFAAMEQQLRNLPLPHFVSDNNRLETLPGSSREQPLAGP